jgi:hypothetical protein
MRYILLLTMVTGALALPASAQTTQPADAAASTQPTAADGELQARVVKVTGRVRYGIPDADGNVAEWHPAKVGDLLPAGAQVRTGLRSKAVLAFGPTAAVIFEQLTQASVAEHERITDGRDVKLALGHGMLRAGVAETTVRCDMTISTPTATLTKRGTMDFGIQYEPSRQRFRVFLDKSGMIELLNEKTNRSMKILPGQYMTEAMEQWLILAAEERFVSVLDVFGLTDIEQLVELLYGSGLGVVEPGAGPNTNSVRRTGKLAADIIAQEGQLPPNAGPSGFDGLFGSNYIPRGEGNFGTGPRRDGIKNQFTERPVKNRFSKRQRLLRR